MKILVCGKGGCGKSTISALLAKELAGRDYKVLVMDSDESNFGLHNQLGLEPPKDFMNYFGGKEVLFEKVKSLQKGWKINELPKQYLSEKDNVSLLAIGKIYDFGEGCACPMNALSSKFLEKLKLEENEFLVADTDAGIEHLGRGVDKGCDIILVVVEPSRESAELAGKIVEMAEDIDKSVYFVLNKVNDQTEGILSRWLDDDKIIASVPEDERIFNYCLEGKEFDFGVEEIVVLADWLEKI